MAKPALSEQLNQIVEAIVARREGVPFETEGKLAGLERIAVALRGLPQNEFKYRLKADLQRRAAMTSTGVKPVREGFHTVTQYLIIPDADRMIEFLKNVFGATEVFRVQRPDGHAIMHAEVKLGDSMIELADASEQFPAAPAALHVFVDDMDSVYAKAIQAGAKTIQAPADQEYGERVATVRDEFGNGWYIASPLKGTSMPEGLRSVTLCLHPEKASALIDFLKDAFGAEEVLVVRTPEGGVPHAKIKIGDSTIELSDAHGPYQPLQCAIHLYVPDTDALYEQALKAGAKSLMAPTDQPYGDRMSGVADPFGHNWFIATHIKDVAF